MKIFSKTALPTIGAAGLWLVASFVPVIPVVSSPVVPDPISTSTFISIQGFLASHFLCGVRYEGTWLTLPVLIGLSVAAFFAGRKLGRRLAGRS